MNRTLTTLLSAFVAAVAISHSAIAQVSEPEILPEQLDYFDDVQPTEIVDGLSYSDSFDFRSGRGSLRFESELMFVRFFQEGGVTDVSGSPGEFDMQFTQRFELGYVGPGGQGVRSRYWYYDADTSSDAGGHIAVDTFCLDLELFFEHALSHKTALECSAGLRFLDFGQSLANASGASAIDGDFRGFGGTAALEAKRRFGLGNFYARGRFSLLMGDVNVDNIVEGVVTPFRADGNTVTQTELALGYEIARRIGRWGEVKVHAGAEWQNWTNVAMADTSFGGVGNDDVLEDAGFAGLVLGIELSR